MKMAALDGIESEWRALYDVQRATSYYPSYSSWMAYGTSFIGTIIENLQVCSLFLNPFMSDGFELMVSDRIDLERFLSNKRQPCHSSI